MNRFDFTGRFTCLSKSYLNFLYYESIDITHHNHSETPVQDPVNVAGIVAYLGMQTGYLTPLISCFH